MMGNNFIVESPEHEHHCDISSIIPSRNCEYEVLELCQCLTVLHAIPVVQLAVAAHKHDAAVQYNSQFANQVLVLSAHGELPRQKVRKIGDGHPYLEPTEDHVVFIVIKNMPVKPQQQPHLQLTIYS